MGQLKVTLKSSRPVKRYSEGFKKQVVKEFEQGVLNKDQLQVKYGIGGKSRVLQWCRKYGKFDYQSPTSNGRPMKNTEQRRIKELEKKLKAAEQKLIVYDKLIEVTYRELDPGIIKKIEAELQKSLQQRKDLP